MALKSGIIFATILIGCLALPATDSDLSQFFEHVDVSSAQNRIVGGSVAPEGAHPHMAAMITGSLFRSLVCGGSILTQRTILTAAHCIAAVFSGGSLNSGLRIVVGTNRWAQGGSLHSVSSNVTHQHYVSATIKNDLGVLYTSTPIEFSATIRPIFLDFELVGADVVSRAAGWGRIRHQGSISAQLLELDVLTVSGPTCVQEVARIAAANNIRPPAVEPHIELCTSHPVGAGHGMCNGDSGSALVRRDRGTQIGIVSWGIPCARGAPDMFVRVSAYEDWFQTYIRN
ncbi:unnamed protein product [Chilo suppressalis]|uniref:Peptidase S1 domain-containing protein n=1 Tax=Chilo suppressalis TaxID=168631 RepID=A0ABN8B3F0_CHISP|nr:hypothetical protein evm_007153 [Chilo suppressalis]CAH0400131.1 unnamed protein product [Chilo suppressalis]